MDLPITETETSNFVTARTPEERSTVPAEPVDTYALADGSVTAEKLAAGSVHREHLADDLLVGGAPDREVTIPAVDPVSGQGIDGDLSITGVIRTHGPGDNTFAGDVAIGVSAVRQDLSVGDYLDVYSGSYSGASTLASIRASSAGNLVLNGGESGDVYLNYESGVDVYMLGDGNVGVGTSNPKADLDVVGRARADTVSAGSDLNIYSGSGPRLGGGTVSSIRASPNGHLVLNPKEQGSVYINYDSGKSMIVSGRATIDTVMAGNNLALFSGPQPNAGDVSASSIRASDAGNLVLNAEENGTVFINYDAGKRMIVSGPATIDTVMAGDNLALFSGPQPKAEDVSASSIRGSDNGNLVLNAEEGGSVYINYDSGEDMIVNGRVTVDVLTVRGGADITEPFRATAGPWEPGHVMVINPDDPGAIRRSSRAYDSTVAGVVSGAGGIRSGLSLYQEDRLDGGVPLALSGRVYAWADASAGAIRPGDLLTTSDVPGHAMKVSEPGRATGAILGKSLTALDSGTGLVLILVALQ